MTPSGSIVRTINPGPNFAFATLRGVEYDPSNNWIYVSQLGASPIINTPQGIARLDGTTGLFINEVNYTNPNDLWLATSGRLIVGSRSLSPGIFSEDLQPIGTFNGSAQSFVTEFVPEPDSLLLTGFALTALTLLAMRRKLTKLTFRAASDSGRRR